MIKELTKDNDKINMIPIIHLINKKIELFFNNTKKNNIININGAWGSGKSTIINNLENFYEKKENTKWIIINLWKYEVLDNPYYNIIQDIIAKILPFNEKENLKDQQKMKFTKIKSLLKKIKSLKLGVPITEPNTGIVIEPYIQTYFDDNVENVDLGTVINEATDEIINLVNSIKSNIIIIFDELDRCTTENQIKFLSYINNIFLKINNVFYLVTSNNEIINANINNKLIDKNSILNEKYTDKIFNVTLNLSDIFFSEDMDFTKNSYIKEFIKRLKINNPRLLNKIFFQISNIFNEIEKNELFSFLNEKEKFPLRKTLSERLEFIIFYIKYTKYKNYDNYSQILKYINTKSTEWKKLLEIFKTIAKDWFKPPLKWTDNNYIDWLINSKEKHIERHNWDFNKQKRFKSLYFCIENNNYILPIWFSALIPFLAHYVLNSNNKIIFRFENDFSNEEKYSSLLYEINSRDYKHLNPLINNVDITLALLEIEKLDLPDYLKEFVDILTEKFDIQNYIDDEFKINFNIIRILANESIFDY